MRTSPPPQASSQRKKPPEHFCPGCDASFSRPSALRTHVLTHTGEKPHVCTRCDRRFTVASNMKRHMATCGSIARRRQAAESQSRNGTPTSNDHGQRVYTFVNSGPSGEIPPPSVETDHGTVPATEPLIATPSPSAVQNPPLSYSTYPYQQDCVPGPPAPSVVRQENHSSPLSAHPERPAYSYSQLTWSSPPSYHQTHYASPPSAHTTFLSSSQPLEYSSLHPIASPSDGPYHQTHVAYTPLSASSSSSYSSSWPPSTLTTDISPTDSSLSSNDSCSYVPHAERILLSSETLPPFPTATFVHVDPSHEHSGKPVNLGSPEIAQQEPLYNPRQGVWERPLTAIPPYAHEHYATLPHPNPSPYYPPPPMNDRYGVQQPPPSQNQHQRRRRLERSLSPSTRRTPPPPQPTLVQRHRRRTGRQPADLSTSETNKQRQQRQRQHATEWIPDSLRHVSNAKLLSSTGPFEPVLRVIHEGGYNKVTVPLPPVKPQVLPGNPHEGGGGAEERDSYAMRSEEEDREAYHPRFWKDGVSTLPGPRALREDELQRDARLPRRFLLALS